MMQLEIKHPWRQWPDETDTAYHRFGIYLELGPDRTLRKVGEKLGKSRGYEKQLQKWSSKFDWVDRCRRYDEHIQLKSLRNREQTIDLAHSKLLGKLDEAIDEYFDIITIENITTLGSDNGQEVDQRFINNLPTKLRAIIDLLDRLGVDFSVDNQPDTDKQERPTYQMINNYILNRKIEMGEEV